MKVSVEQALCLWETGSGVACEMGYRSEGLPAVIPATDIEFIKARTNTFRAMDTQKIVANDLFITGNIYKNYLQ